MNFYKFTASGFRGIGGPHTQDQEYSEPSQANGERQETSAGRWWSHR